MGWGCGPVGDETSDGLRHTASRERWIGLLGELPHFQSALWLAVTSCGSRLEEKLLAENVHAQYSMVVLRTVLLLVHRSFEPPFPRSRQQVAPWAFGSTRPPSPKSGLDFLASSHIFRVPCGW